MLDGKPIISLPPKTVSLKTVDFTSEERNFYNTLEVESREQFKVCSHFTVLVNSLSYMFFCFVTLLDLWLLHLDTFFCVIKDKRIGVMLAAIILFSNVLEFRLSDTDLLLITS